VKGSALLSANLRVPDVIGAAAPRSVLFLSLASAPPRGIRARDRFHRPWENHERHFALIGLMFALATSIATLADRDKILHYRRKTAARLGSLRT
jgi:hypothetical protein